MTQRHDLRAKHTRAWYIHIFAREATVSCCRRRCRRRRHHWQCINMYTVFFLFIKLLRKIFSRVRLLAWRVRLIGWWLDSAWLGFSLSPSPLPSWILSVSIERMFFHETIMNNEQFKQWSQRTHGQMVCDRTIQKSIHFSPLLRFICMRESIVVVFFRNRYGVKRNYSISSLISLPLSLVPPPYHGRCDNHFQETILCSHIFCNSLKVFHPFCCTHNIFRCE